MLSEREARSLLQIERNLRAEDDRFTRSFEAFRVDLDLVCPEPPVQPLIPLLVLRTRLALSLAVLALIPLTWVVAVVSSGDLASFTRIALLPLSSLLLAVGLVLHPDRRRRDRTRR